MGLSSESLLEPHRQQLCAARRVYVAYSGGLDSTVLLHACRQVLGSTALAALHVNHQLSEHSFKWQLFCEHYCSQLAVTCRSFQVAVAPLAEGVEQAARRARYQCFEECLEGGDLLLMAHHQDDQVETLLYRLLRGSGPRGLAGIPVSRALGAGKLLRPLLDYSRAELYAYARRHGLQWIEDDSNQSLRFDRNYLRAEVVPQIAARWPDYRQRLLRSAQQCASAEALLRERAVEDLEDLEERFERLGRSLNLLKFAELNRERQFNLLREWVRRQRSRPPPRGALEAVCSELIAARGDAQPLVSWSEGEFRRYGGRLFLLPKWMGGTYQEVVWRGESQLRLVDGAALDFKKNLGSGLYVAPGTSLQVRYRQGGERCRPQGRMGSAPLKKLLQEYRLEPWLRDRAPLLYIDGQLAAVGDLFVCEDFACPNDTVGFELTWHYPD